MQHIHSIAALLTHPGVMCELIRYNNASHGPANFSRVMAQAAQYLKASRHCNNYTFSKHMTEQLMRDLHKAGVPVTIVRPAIVGAVAYEPCPGYFGNTIAGVTAMILAYATGAAS